MLHVIGLQQQFIFVHIPKTAGNALQKVLSTYSEDTIITRGGKDGKHRFGLHSTYGTSKHSTLNDYFMALGSELFWSMRRITCIRNPWDRAISFYFSPHRGCTAWDRDKFIAMVDKMPPMAIFLRLPADGAGTEIRENLDFIIRYEQLQEDFCKLCTILGLSRKSLPVLNRGNRRPYPEYYDAELARRVGEHFREDIALFGYEFDPRIKKPI